MQLGHPFALFWLLLALPLVALFLLKVHPRRRTVSSILLWQQVIPETRARRWWHRLRYPLTLLIQLLLLALLVLALAEPQWPGQQDGRVLLVVLDNSVSMQAADELPDRLSVAKRHLGRLIDRMGSHDQMALITAGTSAKLHTGLTSRKRTLRRMLAEIRPTDGPSRLADAITIARQLRSQTATPQLFVATDPGGRIEVPAEDGAPDVRWLICGTLSDNVGVTQFQVRRQLLDPLGFECLVEVTSFAARPVSCRLHVTLNQQLLDVIPIQLQPHQSLLKVLSYVSAKSGTLSAKLEVSDALAADDTALARLAPRTPRPVTLVTPGNVYLEKVLAAVPLVQLSVTRSLPQADGSQGAVIIDRLPVDRLPPGRSMVVQPIRDNSFWQLGPAVPDALVGRPQSRSPLLVMLQLDELPVSGIRQLQLSANASVLASTTDGVPVLAIVPHPDGQTLVLNIDLQRGDFAWRTAFPLLMANAVSWLAGQTATFQAAYAAGDMVSLAELTEPPGPPESSTAAVDARLPAVTWRGEVQSPDGELSQLSSTGVNLSVGPLDRIGIWTIQRQVPDDAGLAAKAGPTLLSLACNVVNRRESNLRAGRPEPVHLASAGRAGQPPWFYLVAAALLFLAVEWWLYQRRWIS
jgi:hypothetical protein